MSQTEKLIKVTDSHIQNVFGQYDVFMKKMERTLHVSFVFRDDCLKIIGEERETKQAEEVITQLLTLSERGNTITEQNVDYALSLTQEDRAGEIVELDKNVICHTVLGKPVKPKTIGQQSYVKQMQDNNRSLKADFTRSTFFAP